MKAKEGNRVLSRNGGPGVVSLGWLENRQKEVARVMVVVVVVRFTQTPSGPIAPWGLY